MTSRKLQALALAAALVAGYGGAAAYTALAAPAAPAAPEFGPGDGLTRYVVAAAAGTVDDGLLAELSAVDGVRSAQPLSDGRALVATDALTPSDLRAVRGVEDVEPSASVPLAATVTDPWFGTHGWHLENTGTNAVHQYPVVADADIDAGAAWDVTRGAGVVVAVIDSGFDLDHPDLAGSLWVNPAEPCGTVDTDGNGKAGDCHGWNWYANNADVDNGVHGSHGAAVSGSVGARADNGIGLAGVAPEATIMPLVAGGGSTVDVVSAAEAIRYAVDHGADVINASWGGPMGGYALQVLQSAVAYAAAHDVLVVAAAGNDTGNRDTTIAYPASLTDWNVITVGSSTAADTASSFSAYGATAVDLFAPGSWVTTTSNSGGYAPVNGTSFAAPLVAGALALYRAAMPDAGAAELKQTLLDDVDPRPAFAGRSVTGGRLALGRLSGTPAESVRYAFTSMTAPAGTVTPRIGVSGSAAAGDYSVAVGLGMEHAGEIWALADKPVTLGGATVATDDTGSAVFDLGTLAKLDGLGLSPTVPLADGRYVLTVQMLRNGTPVGRAAAAPLLVRTATPGSGPGVPGPTPGTPGGGSSPTTPAPGGTAPPSTPGPGGSTPGGGSAPAAPVPTTPGTPAPAPGTAPTPGTPGTPAPGTPAPGTPAPGAPGTPIPSTPAPSTPAPGAPAPGTPTPGTPAPGTGPGGSSPAPSTPPGPGGGTTPSAPGNDTTTYPSVGDFRITSLSPNAVAVGGGTVVTITGTALPVGARVRIGASAEAAVVSASTTRLQFRTPARVAGVHDVTVFAPDGRTTVLAGALTYLADAPSGGGTAPGTPPGGGTSPAPGTVPPPSGPGTTPADPGTGSGPVERTGPHGERLVRSATFSALRGIWSIECSASCTGVAI
ncbi:IPT/TIG domain-containing protein [Blastococcus aggregatus]|uniref:IPT/TIG domain-containing protein n=1 Tax=Blastococcus aggregatus TaxID=38502 RepID=A0A285VC29_9ACTN|nr:S8 family serine peptidase [Blastococcus aggregatus]SOC51639.1 IPT/TIG domain-containing protein [Blastococcus aggregatus]